jgi:peptidoglycan/xylan/chitin deacetylase (PgdA/CDA1 family)
VLNILPTNYEEVLDENNIISTREDITYLLNNGYVFIPVTEEIKEQEKEEEEDNKIVDIKNENIYIDLSSEYNTLSHTNRNIYITSQLISHYFTTSFKDIKNSSIEYDTLRKTLKRKLVDLQSRIAFSGGESLIEGRGIYSLPVFQKERLESIARYSNIDLVIEKDIENYEYIEKQILEIESSFSEFNILLEEISSVLAYIKNVEKGEDITNEKLVILDVLHKLPKFELEEENNYIFGYLLQNINNELYISPYVSDNNDLISKNINYENFNTDYDIPPSFQEEGSVRIPVLMYHHIAIPSDDSSEFKKGLYVDPEMFERQIAYLTRKNYRSINVEEFYTILQSGNNPTQKTILITFDDSLLSHYHQAFPILKRYGHTGVFFVPSDVGLLPREQLIEMSNSGMDIQSHSATHPILPRISSSAILEREIVGSKHTLEELTGKPVTAFAYPGCVGNRIVFNMVSDSGYNLGFSCGRAIDHIMEKRLIISRAQVYNDMNQFLTILSGTY